MRKSLVIITFLIFHSILFVSLCIHKAKSENILDSTYSKEEKSYSDDTYNESSIEPDLIFEINDDDEEEIKIRYMWGNIKWK